MYIFGYWVNFDRCTLHSLGIRVYELPDTQRQSLTPELYIP